MKPSTLVWYRRDLRVLDHEALTRACAQGTPVFALYVDETNPRHGRALGSATRWWLHHSLDALRGDLSKLNIKLILKRGATAKMVAKTAKEVGATTVHAMAVHEPAEAEQVARVEERLRRDGRTLTIAGGNLLQPPGTILNKQGGGYKVFTPYWKSWRTFNPSTPLPVPSPVAVSSTECASDNLDAWHLLPSKSDWALGLRETWRPGADGARFLLNTFIQSTLGDYQDARDYPAETGTTRLSAHLHFGEISPRQVWHAVRDAAARATEMKIENDSWNIIRQLCWRDFNHDLLSRHPNMATRNIDTRFDAFPWQSEPDALRRWQQGDTGYPIVDAGMRELWTTGWMHNRVRMIVASFLVKHLLIHWRSGEEWFWDTLVDADVANNAANWQWVAGCGADAAPYFRIFNPILQGEKFDPNGDYVRKWVPERADLSNKLIHKPTPADAGLFEENYPTAIVEHGFARKRALAAFGSLKR